MEPQNLCSTTLMSTAPAVATPIPAAPVPRSTARRTLTARRSGIHERVVQTSDGVPIAVSDWLPDGPVDHTVFLLHGLCLTRHSWQGVVRRLRRPGIRVVYYDHRGHGSSGRAAPATYSPGQLAQDLAEIVTALRISGPLTMAGHSMGGMAAQIPIKGDPVANEALAAMGLSMSDAVRILLKRVVNDQAFPLELKVPNAALRVRIAGVEPARPAASAASATTSRAWGFPWIGQAQAQGGPGGGMRERLVSELQLSADQQAMLDAVLAQSRPQFAALRDPHPVRRFGAMQLQHIQGLDLTKIYKRFYIKANALTGLNRNIGSGGDYIQYGTLFYKIIEVKYSFETGWFAVIGCESSELGV